MKALCRAIALLSFLAAAAGCSGRVAVPGSVTPAAAIVAAAPSSATSVRQTMAFSPPAQQSPPAYQAQVFDIYQQPDDIYQQPDDIYQQPDDIYQQPDGIIVVPQGQTPPPYPDGTIPVPLPNGYVYWPDGSVQVAGSDGSFVPAQSSYAQANAGQFESNPWGGVEVTIADPSGVDQPVSVTLPASTIDPGAGGRGGRGIETDSVAVRALGANAASAAAPGVSAISVLPVMVEAHDGATLPLTVGALDFDGHANSLGGASVTWTQPAAGRIVPIGNGSAALYYAPKAGTGIDRFTASVGGFTAGSAVAYYGRQSLAKVVATFEGAPAGATVGFAQTGNLPAPFFEPAVWFAHARGGGFVAHVPQGATYQAFLTLAAPSPGRYATSNGSAFSLANGAATAAVSLHASSAPYALQTGMALPPVATDIRDAAFVSRLLRGRNLFDARSGLQPLLAAGSGRGTVPSGEYAGWSYEWQNQSGTPALVLLEVSGGAPGTRSATIVPAGDGATFSFTSYRSSSALAGGFPLAAVQPGSRLIEGGSWSQSITNGTFTAALAIDRYDAAHQTVGSPLFTERGNYSSAGNGAAAFAGMKLYDANGFLLWAYDAMQSPARGLDANARSFSATLVHDAPTAAGTPVQTRYRLAGVATVSGAHVSLAADDGSATLAFDLATTPQNETVANGTLVRGSLPVAQFAVDGGGNVTATVGADAASGFPGTQLAFPL